MWSETAAPEEIARLADELRDVFGALPTSARRATTIDLPPGTTPAQVASAATAPVAWLDSGEQGRHLIALSTAAEVSWAGGTLTVAAPASGKQFRTRVAPFDGVDAVLAALHASAGAVRLFGYLAYDLGATIEELPALPPADQPLPGFWLGAVDAWIEAVPGEGDGLSWSLHSTSREREDAAKAHLLAALAEPPSDEGPTEPSEVAVTSVPDAAGYQAAVARTVQRIHAGDFFETNICRRLEVPWAASPRRLYDRMREASAGSHGAYLAAADWAILSVSPETYLRVRGDVVSTRPIKGTRRRGADPAADAALQADLLASDKEAAELAMIVDLVRNDLGRVCRPGTVEVTEHRAVMQLPTVHHTYSVVRGALEPDTTVGRLLRASFPPGSITGAPKIEAIRAAAAEEPRRRGVAMGAIGWIDPCGDLELSVAIRTATVAAGLATYHAGCGIVAESDPEAEFEETMAKAQPFLRALSGD